MQVLTWGHLLKTSFKTVIKMESGPPSREQFLLELRSSSELKNAPKIAQRKTMTIDGSSAEEEGKESVIRVMQFNTLARALSSPEVGKFEMLEEGALDWPFRRARGDIQWQSRKVQ